MMAVVLTAAFTSCGSGSTTIKTDTDSVAYAIGVDFGNGLFQFDSTLNVDIVAQAVRDVFAKKAKMTPEESGEYIRYYMTTGRANKNKVAAAEFMKKAEGEDGVTKSATGLVYKVEQAGQGDKAVLGDTLVVNYVLYSMEGKKLESSYDRGEPMRYENTENAMIKGFNEGVSMLSKGGKATLWIPSELGYGDNGSGPIAPAAALKFEIEVVDVIKPAAGAAKPAVAVKPAATTAK